MTTTFTFSLASKMKKHLMTLLAAAAWATGPVLAGSTIWDGSYTSFAGSYLIYSNDLDEKAPPTVKDRRVSFSIEGPLAKKMFDSIGPDQKDACGASPDLHIRNRGDLACTLDQTDKRSPYTCHFGLDLKSGKSIAGSTC